MSFIANYPGVCGYCGERYPAGTEIRSTENDGWVHDDCAEPGDVDAPQRNEQRCPDCHLIHAGECW